jgi:phosphatidylglycerophosphate synthase
MMTDSETKAPSYEYGASVKSDVSDELINIYLLRPLAGLIVRVLVRTPVTPNQVTIASTVAGLAAAACYVRGTPMAWVAAGLLVTLKDLLDSADGQLARAKRMYTRTGRFLDSIGDFIVNVALFGTIGFSLTMHEGSGWVWLAALLGLLGITLRVSYHVFYQTNFLHMLKAYENNRVTEEIRPEDRAGDKGVVFLQRIFQAIYGWQDRAILGVDRWCQRGIQDEMFRKEWYQERIGLRISGFLGIGTELFILMLCSVTQRLSLYLWLNLVLMNGVMAGSIFYRRWILFPRMVDARRSGGTTV